jgi:prolyl-tRNA editing enzyme YbaK/EbsC (Cys-tRNA(Pro) deacylase)
VTEWPEPVQRVSAVLKAAAVDARLEEFGDGTPTARGAAKAIGCDLSQIVKSLVFVGDGAYVLALVPGDRRADEAAIAAAVDMSAVRIATADEVMAATGFEPGGVAPFPQRSVARAVIERELLRHQIVWIGAGTTSHMAGLPPAELQRLAGAAVGDIVARG